MLKIKDNVDLRELEKYGFKHIDRTQMLIPRYRRGRIAIYYDCWVNNKKYTPEEANQFRINNGLLPLYDRVVCIRGEDEIVMEEDTDNDIFDLIKADLVEKVVQQ